MVMSDISGDPFELLTGWLRAAREADEPLPDAMTLATVGSDGWPAARMVILRGLDSGLVFYTDRESDKGAELAACPRAAIVLHWLVPTHRQVRETYGCGPETAKKIRAGMAVAVKAASNGHAPADETGKGEEVRT